MYDELWTKIITLVLVPFLIWFFLLLQKVVTAKVDEWLAKTSIAHKEELRAALYDAQQSLSRAVYTAVMETQTTFVSELQKVGPLTKSQEKAAFNKSFSRVKEIMSMAGMEIIENATGALDSMIQSEIEAILPTVKTGLTLSEGRCHE